MDNIKVIVRTKEFSLTFAKNSYLKSPGTDHLAVSSLASRTFCYTQSALSKVQTVYNPAGGDAKIFILSVCLNYCNRLTDPLCSLISSSG